MIHIKFYEIIRKILDTVFHSNLRVGVTGSDNTPTPTHTHTPKPKHIHILLNSCSSMNEYVNNTHLPTVRQQDYWKRKIIIKILDKYIYRGGDPFQYGRNLIFYLL